MQGSRRRQVRRRDRGRREQDEKDGEGVMEGIGVVLLDQRKGFYTPSLCAQEKLRVLESLQRLDEYLYTHL